MSRAGRFRFPLDALLKVRSLKEEQARLELAAAIEEYRQTRRALEATRTRLAGARADLSGPRTRQWTAADYHILKSYLDRLTLSAEALTRRLERQEVENRARQQALEKLHQEKRLLERWRERLYREFIREVKTRLEKEVEDAALARWPGR